MPIYAITYDLNKDKNYKKLWDELERLDGHKAARSFYLLNLTSETSKEVLDHLKSFIDKDDTMIVVKTKAKDIKTFRALEGTTNWLAANSD